MNVEAPTQQSDAALSLILFRDLYDPRSFVESVCPTRIPVSSRDEKGFELIIGMKLQLKAKKIPGSLSSETAYALSATSDITENTRWASGFLSSPSPEAQPCDLLPMSHQGDLPRRPPPVLRVCSHSENKGIL